MSKTVGRVFKVLGNVWDVVLIVFVVAILLMRFAPMAFGYVPVVCESNSMAPTFHTNSLCYIDTNYDVSGIEEGDIIAFELGEGKQVTHRVHEITEEGIITKGDANKDVDIAPIHEDQIIGENVLQLEYVGMLFKAFPNMLLISIIAFMVLLKILLGFVSGLLLKEESDGDEEKEYSNINNNSSTSN